MQVARLGLPRRPSKGAGLVPSNLGLLHEPTSQCSCVGPLSDHPGNGVPDSVRLEP
jgi:hypothetical protein